jgi:hypothetical protein
LGTLRLHGIEVHAVRDFFKHVEEASPETLKAMDKGAHTGGNDPCSQAWALLRQRVEKLKMNLQEGRERKGEMRAKRLKERMKRESGKDDERAT